MKIRFIVGLSNWGKTTCIKKMVGVNEKVLVTTYKNKYRVLQVGNKKIMILQYSNCDLGLHEFIKRLMALLDQYQQNSEVDFVLVALCCSSIEDMLQILDKVKEKGLFDVELVFLEKHWDGVAQLCVDDICNNLKAKKHNFGTEIIASSRDC